MYAIIITPAANSKFNARIKSNRTKKIVKDLGDWSSEAGARAYATSVVADMKRADMAEQVLNVPQGAYAHLG